MRRLVLGVSSEWAVPKILRTDVSRLTKPRAVRMQVNVWVGQTHALSILNREGGGLEGAGAQPKSCFFENLDETFALPINL